MAVTMLRILFWAGLILRLAIILVAMFLIANLFLNNRRNARGGEDNE